MRGNDVPSPARPAARLSEAGRSPNRAAREALPGVHTPSPSREHVATT
jgi:hypothetical protein